MKRQDVRRYELGEKFWELSRDGTQVHVRWGESGNEKTKASSFATAALAKSEAARLIEKVAGLGYLRVSNVVREPHLEKAVLRDFKDPKPWQVYGDWLAEQGDPRGELAALVVAKPKRVAAYVRQHAAELFGSLAPLFANRALTVESWNPGFVGHLEVDIDRLALASADLGAVLALPVCTLLHGLTTASSRSDNWEHSMQQLAESPQARTLQTLIFASDGDHHLGDVSESLAALRALRSLQIHASAFEPGSLSFPALREFVHGSGEVTEDEVHWLSYGKFPAIERLELSLNSAYEAELGVEHLVERLLRLKTLRDLTLSSVHFDSDLIEQLLDSEMFTRLRVLDLDGCLVDEGGADVLRENARALSKLKRLALPAVGDDEMNEPLDLGLEEQGDDDEDEDEA